MQLNVTQPAVLIRLRPTGPWRSGPGDGGHDRLDALYRSDRLYSAVTLAMQRLGWLEPWLEATARAANPGVAFSSLFPFQGDTLFAPPPATLWPPPSSLVTASSPVFLSKIRWSTARFVPINVIESILIGQNILADQWLPDAESGCLLRRDRPSASPFRAVMRSRAAVDRVSGVAVHTHTCAGVEFEPGAGLWAVARYASEDARADWNDRLLGAFRLLADSGFGGRRSSGWGHATTPEFQPGTWPGLLMPKVARMKNGKQAAANGESDHPLYWLLSIYSPARSDEIDWRQGDYRVAPRGGSVESDWAPGLRKKTVRMIVEGSVIAARAEPAGAAVDVAPEDFPHSVYRSGLALALKLPPAGPAPEELVETPGDPEALEQKPCADAAQTGIASEEAAPVPDDAAPEPEAQPEREL
jgi:CRISPR type III-A-associated RAMP protein Csm4